MIHLEEGILTAYTWAIGNYFMLLPGEDGAHRHWSCRYAGQGNVFLSMAKIREGGIFRLAVTKILGCCLHEIVAAAREHGGKGDQ